MIEKNTVLTSIIPETPKITPREQIFLYVPIVTSKSPGIAKFNEHFDISQDGTVSLQDALKTKIDKLVINGNGTKYLSDDGSYKTIVLNENGDEIPNGGTTGQVLKKKSNENQDVEWGDVVVPNPTSGVLEKNYLTTLKIGDKIYPITEVKPNPLSEGEEGEEVLISLNINGKNYAIDLEANPDIEEEEIDNTPFMDSLKIRGKYYRISRVKPLGLEDKVLQGLEIDGVEYSIPQGGGSGSGESNIIVDRELNKTSTNPVQNKVIAEELEKVRGEIVAGVTIDNTVLVGQDENGGNIYEQIFSNGYTATFTAPKGEQGVQGEQGIQGVTGSKIVSTEFVGIDEKGGRIYRQTFDDGSINNFTAPKGENGVSINVLPIIYEDKTGLPNFESVNIGDGYLVEDTDSTTGYTLYFKGEGGTDWSIVKNFGRGADGKDGPTGAKIVSTELIGQDENGGNIYKQTFDNGVTSTFTAPIQPAIVSPIYRHSFWLCSYNNSTDKEIEKKALVTIETSKPEAFTFQTLYDYLNEIGYDIYDKCYIVDTFIDSSLSNYATTNMYINRTTEANNLSNFGIFAGATIVKSDGSIGFSGFTVYKRQESTYNLIVYESIIKIGGQEGIPIDNTLTVPGAPADAKAVGDAINNRFNGANKAVSFVNYSSMISSLNSLGKTSYNVGQNVMIVTLNVPDLWISEIVETSLAYTYISDDDFVNELNTNGSVQVGYFKLSALETQKVDLTDYKTKDTQIEGTSIVNENGIAEIPIATTNKTPGLVVLDKNFNYGIDIIRSGVHEGELITSPPNSTDINNRVPYEKPQGTPNGNTCRPITPANIDYAVKQVLANPPASGYQGWTGYQWTPEEQASARETLGAAAETELENKVDKWEKDSGGYANLLLRQPNGTYGPIRLSYTPLAYAVVPYSSGGRVKTNAPTEDNDCVNLQTLNSALENSGGGTQLYKHELIIDKTENESGFTYKKLEFVSTQSTAFTLINDALLDIYNNPFTSLAKGYSVEEVTDDYIGYMETYTNFVVVGKQTFQCSVATIDSIRNNEDILNCLPLSGSIEEYAPTPLQGE